MSPAVPVDGGPADGVTIGVDRDLAVAIGAQDTRASLIEAVEHVTCRDARRRFRDRR